MPDLSIGRFRRHASSFKSSLRDSNSKLLGDLLDAQLVDEQIRAFNLVFRHRIFTPLVTLWTWLAQVLSDDPSCRAAVCALRDLRVARGLTAIATRTGSYTKAKARLPLGLLQRLTIKLGERTDAATSDPWRWRGSIEVKVVDGSRVSMPDTAVNEAEFPRLRLQRKGVGFPQAMLLGVFSLSTGALLRLENGKCKGKGTGELALLRQLWPAFKRGETLLGDALFSSYAVMAEASRRGVDVVAELKSSRYGLLRKTKLDQIITIKKPIVKPAYLNDEEFAVLPSELRVRVVRVEVACSGFRPRTKYILTTHLSAEVTRKDIADLYRQRWNVELNFNALKTSLGMSMLRSRSPQMARKEIWAHMLAYNLLRSVLATAAVLHETTPERLSFRAAQQTMRSVHLLLGVACDAEQLLAAMLRGLGEHRIGDRPDRYEPRAVKRQQNRYRALNVPRDQARKKHWKRAA